MKIPYRGATPTVIDGGVDITAEALSTNHAKVVEYHTNLSILIPSGYVFMVDPLPDLFSKSWICGGLRRDDKGFISIVFKALDPDIDVRDEQPYPLNVPIAKLYVLKTTKQEYVDE